MSIFSKPYPKDTTVKRKVVFASLFGMFVFLFLFFFQPFGLNQWEIGHKTFRLLGYGFITTVILLINFLLIERMFPKWFAESNWKVWKEMIWALWIILLIGICNLLYSCWQIGFSLTVGNFLLYQWITLLIGLFPVAISTVINYNRLQTKNLKAALELNRVIESDTRTIPTTVKPEMVELTGDGNKESLTLNPDNLLYIEAADNYVEVVWLEHQTLQKKLLRNRLKNLEAQFVKTPHIFRCHRSFMVNLNFVVKVSGNSQGYKLHFSQTETTVPVSRQYNEVIRKKISDLHSIHPN